MVDDILAFQAGREAAIFGHPRDRRRSNDWLEGYDLIMADEPWRKLTKPEIGPDTRPNYYARLMMAKGGQPPS